VQDVPIADAKPEEIQDLLGGALFRALYKWMVDTGPVYLLPTGEKRSTSALAACPSVRSSRDLIADRSSKDCSWSACGTLRPTYTSLLPALRNTASCVSLCPADIASLSIV
jgi:hypothetical protein